MAPRPQLDREALEQLAERMDQDTEDERDEDLGAFLSHAWPTLDAQNC